MKKAENLPTCTTLQKLQARQHLKREREFSVCQKALRFFLGGGGFPMFLSVFLSVLNWRQKEVFILGVGELGLGLQVLWDFRNLDFLTGKHGVQGQIEWRKSEAKMEGNLEIIVQLLIGTWFQISMIFPFFISFVFVFNSDRISFEFCLSIIF